MIYLKEFDSHASYESEVNGVGVDFKIPNVSYCNDVNDVHFNPYNLIEFYVGDITGTTPQTVKIYTDSSTSVDVQVSEDNKWYSYVLPKNKRLCKIEGDSVKKVVVKADINTNDYTTFIPSSTVEASFKGSNTSNVTYMDRMFGNCTNLTSLDLSSFDTSNVTTMESMFNSCSNLTSLDLSNFDTSKVTKMSYMFDGCRGLTSLNLSNFNTSNLSYMTSMFNGCTNLGNLDLSGWDISDTSYMMFNYCENLKTIRMVGCNQTTIDKIKKQLKNDGITRVTIVTK